MDPVTPVHPPLGTCVKRAARHPDDHLPGAVAGGQVPGDQLVQLADPGDALR